MRLSDKKKVAHMGHSSGPYGPLAHMGHFFSLAYSNTAYAFATSNYGPYGPLFFLSERRMVQKKFHRKRYQIKMPVGLDLSTASVMCYIWI